MPANMAAPAETHWGTFLRMQPIGQTQAVVDSVLKRQTFAIKTRINNLQLLISAITVSASTHLPKSTDLVAKGQESWQEITDNINDVAATVSQKTQD